MFHSIIVDNDPVEKAVKHVQQQMWANLRAAGF
jgi:hypothetical protein